MWAETRKKASLSKGKTSCVLTWAERPHSEEKSCASQPDYSLQMYVGTMLLISGELSRGSVDVKQLEAKRCKIELSPDQICWWQHLEDLTHALRRTNFWSKLINVCSWNSSDSDAGVHSTARDLLNHMSSHGNTNKGFTCAHTCYFGAKLPLLHRV